MKKYCVYTHSFAGVVFYVGSGRLYEEEGYTSRPYQFSGRSKEWKKFCNEEIDKVVVEILFETNDKQEAFDKEEEITRYYMKLEMLLVNKDFGIRKSEETKKKMSLAQKGENHHRKGKNLSEEHRKKISESRKGEKNPMAKKVLITDNETGEQINVSSIKDAHEFISQNGFDKAKGTLQYHLNKGVYNFENYTMKLATK